MTRLSKIRGKQGCRNNPDSDVKNRTFIAFCAAMFVLDNYCLSKTDSGVSITACKNVFKNKFSAKEECDLLKPLGDWLCSLPKGIWDDKEIKNNDGRD